MPVYAEVVKKIGRTGARGEIEQVMVKILDGEEKGRIKRRNVKGKCRIGDIIILMAPELEAKQLKER